MIRFPPSRAAVSLCLLLSPALALAQADPYGDTGYMGYEPPNVARMTDSDASCEQLFAEADHLEKKVASLPKPEDPMALSQKMTDEIMASQQKAMQSARARGMASSVLGMVPGVGGLAAQALSPGMRSMGDTNEQMQKHMKAIQESTQASMAIHGLQARQEHLTDLFLDRGCKVSQLDPAKLAQARTQWVEPAAAAATQAVAASVAGGPVADSAAISPAAAAAPVNVAEAGAAKEAAEETAKEAAPPDTQTSAPR